MLYQGARVVCAIAIFGALNGCDEIPQSQSQSQPEPQSHVHHADESGPGGVDVQHHTHSAAVKHDWWHQHAHWEGYNLRHEHVHELGKEHDPPESWRNPPAPQRTPPPSGGGGQLPGRPGPEPGYGPPYPADEPDEPGGGEPGSADEPAPSPWGSVAPAPVRRPAGLQTFGYHYWRYYNLPIGTVGAESADGNSKGWTIGATHFEKGGALIDAIENPPSNIRLTGFDWDRITGAAEQRLCVTIGDLRTPLQSTSDNPIFGLRGTSSATGEAADRADWNVEANVSAGAIALVITGNRPAVHPPDIPLPWAGLGSYTDIPPAIVETDNQHTAIMAIGGKTLLVSLGECS